MGFKKKEPPAHLKAVHEVAQAAAQLSLACEGLLQWSRDNGGCDYVDDCPRWIEQSYKTLAAHGIDPQEITSGYLEVLKEAKSAWEREPENGKLVTLAQLRKWYPVAKFKAPKVPKIMSDDPKVYGPAEEARRRSIRDCLTGLHGNACAVADAVDGLHGMLNQAEEDGHAAGVAKMFQPLPDSPDISAVLEWAERELREDLATGMTSCPDDFREMLKQIVKFRASR